MSQQGSTEQRPPDAEGVESSPRADQGDTPKKGRKKKGEKKPIPEMKLTVVMQQWLQKENPKAVKIRLTDSKIHKTKTIIMCTLLCSSKWHHNLPGKAYSEEFGEGMLSKLVCDKAKNTNSVTVEEVENHYLLLQVGPGGKDVGVQNVPKSLVQRMRQRLTRFLAADRICMAYIEWEPERVSTLAASWRRTLPRFPPSPIQPLGYHHYRHLGHSGLDALIDQRTNPTKNLKRKLDAVVGRITDMDVERQGAATRNVRQRVQ